MDGKKFVHGVLGFLLLCMVVLVGVTVFNADGAVYRNKATRAVWSGEMLKYVPAADTSQTDKYLADTFFVLLSDTGGVAPVKASLAAHLLIGTMDTLVVPITTRNISITGTGNFRVWLNDTSETPFVLGGNAVNLSLDVKNTVRQIIIVGMDTSDVFINCTNTKDLD
jgi:hypothetical protein